MTLKNEKRRKSFIPRFFGLKQRKGPKKIDDEDSIDLIAAQFGDSISFSAPVSPLFMAEFSGRESTPTTGRVNFSEMSPLVPTMSETQSFRVFATTWNVGGKPPHIGLDLNDFLPSDDQSDIYFFGFQEIVPLNAGNVLAIEDSEPAVKWLKVINAALNKPQETNKYAYPSTRLKYSNSTSDATGAKTMVYRDPKTSTSLFFQKPSLKEFSKIFKIEKGRRLKTCNCLSEGPRKYYKESCFRCSQSYLNADDTSEEEEEESCGSLMTDTVDVNNTTNQLKYSLVASKQMVGIFVTVWVKREHVQHIGHLRVSTVGCGILGYLGNKGCISVSMSLYQSSFCFVCSHLASGEKEGDELKRNSDVIEILKSTQFRRICKVPLRRIPEKILGHDKIIWLGDLNYRIALSYNETKKLLDDNDWDALLEKDQLKIEREAGRVFKGWKEGNIYFAPTYKYSDNSDAYAGENMTSKKKRRTPAWCDRILWHGDGMVQLSYIRGESRFSDHRPVCSVFKVEVEVPDCRFRKTGSCHNMKVGVEELLPPSTS